MSSDFLEIFKQMSFLSSVLAGFAITAAIQLVSLTKKEPLVNATIAVFIISSVILAVATTVFVLVMTATIGPPGFPRPSDEWILHFIGGIGVLPVFGTLFFLAGIGLVGWLRSKILGVVTTISAVLASVLIIYILWSITGIL